MGVRAESEISRKAEKMNFSENGITGHRGDPQHFPQNTLSGFAAAIRMGCDWVETDIHVTRDGHVVISHDDNTRAEADHWRIIRESTLQELRELNMAAHFNMIHEDHPAMTEKMPTLPEVFELFRNQDRVRLSLQPKAPESVDAAIRVIRDMGFPEEMLGFNDGNLNWMIRLKQAFPGAAVFYDRMTVEHLEEDIALSLENKFHSLVVNENYLTAEAVQRIAAAGLVPGVWTINNPGEMDHFIAMGVKRFYTDFPAVLMKKLA